MNQFKGVIYKGSSIDKIYDLTNITFAHSLKSTILMVKHQRADYTIMPEQLIPKDINQEAFQFIKIDTEEVFIGISKKSKLNLQESLIQKMEK